MERLKTEFLGINFPNPFILAAGPPTANGAIIIEAFKAGWGGAVLKTIGLVPTKHPSPRVYAIKSGRDKRGMIDIELFSELTLERWEVEIDLIRASFPERPIIASIAGGGDPHEWQELVRRVEPHGINGYEMNVSCPNLGGKEKGEDQAAQNTKAMALAVGWIKEVTELPVIVKLTPNVTDVAALARAAQAAGADAVTTGNSLSGLGGIDLDTFVPLPAVDGISIFGGYGGPGLKPVSLKCTAVAAHALQIPVIGCGGISTWQDAAEYLAVGASIVEVCTAVMWNGRQIIESFTKGLEAYLESKGYKTPNDIKGKALSRIGSFSDLNLSVKLAASVDDSCTGCGICVEACASGGYQAITLASDTARIDLSRCDGCGLCVGVCPEESIHLNPRP